MYISYFVYKNRCSCVTQPFLKRHLDNHGNFSHCKIEQVISCSDSYTLELSLPALNAAISSESLPLNASVMGS